MVGSAGNSDQTTDYDVIIIGGGPAGTTAGTLLRKYDPNLRVLILEREKFPREHVGESQLPPIGAILDEMEVWDKVEAANFPIKVGATYRWGSSPDLWDFEFLPLDKFRDEPRPAKYVGQRRLTAFQVERALYDDILLRHAAEFGCEVREECGVRKIHHENKTITSIETDKGETLTARYYLDASGHIGVLRRAVGVKTTSPTSLQNIAMWDYWENTDWAVEIGVGGTRVQVLSVAAGWIWFIPLGPTRTSIGFICPVEHYKERGVSPSELYDEALKSEPRIQHLTRNATRDNEVKTTKDWSFLAEELVGPNWFLIGESAGFADPVLAGGMTLAHMSARHAAYAILELDRGDHSEKWLKHYYHDSQKKRIQQYIRFADFWYASNGQFTDLQAFTSSIAKDAGLELNPKEAFRWLSFGGFAHEDYFLPGLGGLDLLAVKEVTKLFTNNEDPGWEINKYNVFKMNLVGAKKDSVPILNNGKIIKAEAYIRGGNVLPVAGMFKHVIEILKQASDVEGINAEIQKMAARSRQTAGINFAPGQAYATLETMLLDRWVTGKFNKKKKRMTFEHGQGKNQRGNFHPNEDNLLDQADAAVADGSG